MNILIFSWRGPGHPNAGGAEYVAMKHASHWVGAGHQVTLFTSSFENSKREDYLDGVRVVRSGGQILGVRLNAVKYYLFGNHDKFDLVIDEFHGLPFFTPLFVNTNKLGVIHEVAKEVWKLNPWPVPLRYIPWVFGSLFERFIFLFYRGVPFMTVSKSTKLDLINWGVKEKNIHIIHNGINTPPKTNTAKNKSKTAMYMGALASDKGIFDALEVFSNLYQNDKSWKFYVAGKGDVGMKKYLKDFVHENSLKDNLTYFGYVSEKKKYELLSKSHILVNPSVREGWGLVNLEANSVGTPVIGYDVAGVKDSILDGKTGVLCADKSPAAIASEVEKLAKNKAKYMRMSKNAIDWASKFDWDKSVEQSLELVEGIVV
jgi:glycosyltransferase involved in cell wall biosynthesis